MIPCIKLIAMEYLMKNLIIAITMMASLAALSSQVYDLYYQVNDDISVEILRDRKVLNNKMVVSDRVKICQQEFNPYTCQVYLIDEESDLLEQAKAVEKNYSKAKWIIVEFEFRSDA